MMDWLPDIFNLSLIAAALRTTAPILLVALGGGLVWKTGIMNIGLEGIMLLGAFFAVVGSVFSGSALVGLLAAVAVGIVMALIFALFAVTLKANEIVVGLAINIFAGGFTVAAMKQIFGTRGSVIDTRIVGFPALWMDWLDRVPVLGEVLNGFTPFVYVSFIAVVAVTVFLFRTPFGLHLRVVGENESAAESLGINVTKVKYIVLVIAGIFAGVAGAHLSLGYINMFTENMSSGRGFMALAAIIFADGVPFKLGAAALLFGFSDVLAMRLQGFGVPSYLVLMVPYLITLGLLFLISLPRTPKQVGVLLDKVTNGRGSETAGPMK